MLNYLIRRFVPNWQNTADPAVRTAYSVFAGALGILLNLALFAVKLPIGMITGSIAITSDAFNNLSDMGSSLIGVIGARLAGRRPDREHPFGHGRLEYVSALIVSFLILLVGFELMKESIDKMLHPEPVDFNPVLLGILALSMLVKFFMYYYNHRLGVRIESAIMKAAASDSRNDAVTTGVVVIASIVNRYVSWPVDAVAGLGLSLLILYSGYCTAKDTIDLLLGGKPDPELVKAITRMVREGEGVTGVHDLIIHDYGPGRIMASIHAEVPADADIIKVHETIDATEQRIESRLGVPIVIHMDPVVLNDGQLEKLRHDLDTVIHETDGSITFHDLRMTDGENRINVIFDLVTPSEYSLELVHEITQTISEKMAAIDPRYTCVIHVDQDFIGAIRRSGKNT